MVIVLDPRYISKLVNKIFCKIRFERGSEVKDDQTTFWPKQLEDLPLPEKKNTAKVLHLRGLSGLLFGVY